MNPLALARRAAALAAVAAFDVHGLAVTGTSPPANVAATDRLPIIAVEFDKPVAIASVSDATFRVWGRSRGRMAGTIALDAGGYRLTFTPSQPFFPGETAYVQLAQSIRAVDDTTLQQGGYAFQFTTRAGVSDLAFVRIDTVSVRTPDGNPVVLYGGAFPDVNADGWIDFIAIAEEADDMRVLLNRADGSGLLGPVLQPTNRTGHWGSPSEAVDFNWDGKIDMAVSASGAANPATGAPGNVVSVLLGNGDGTFAPHQPVPVGIAPHSLAALDVDGDADIDLVNANQVSDDVSVILNDGNGVFGNPTFFDAGGSGEYSLAAGDMDGDGILDIVTGTRNDEELHVLLGNGDGTFARVPGTFDAGGRSWMIALGDVDGDRRLDVATVNSQSNTGAILLGNGDGTLQAAQVTTFGGSVIATDLGDLDGDGDLDWVVSSYGAARWYVRRNDGAGQFTAHSEIAAPGRGSCASLYDFDNDGDLDMALADEQADVVLLMRNGPDGVVFQDGFE